MARRNPRESSGRLWLTADVARCVGVGPERVRQLVDEGLLTAHFTPSGVAVFYREEVELWAAARRAYELAAPRLKEAFAQARPKVVSIQEAQGTLPLTEKA